MKKCLLTLLCITYFSCLFAQNLERKYPSDKNSPVWTQLMYAEDADVDAVVNAYTAYYKTHKFVKNSHTQYYKRWLRSISRDVDGLQYGEKDPKAVAKSTEKYIERSLQLRAEKGPTSAWQGVGPFDFDKEAESRSYAAGAAHVYGVEQAMSNTDVLYAGTATAGVWKTTDKGENWTLMTADMALNSVFALEIDHTNENVVYFEGNGNVYKTTDGGTTWNTIGDAAFMSASHSAKDIVMHPTNNQVLFLSSNNGLYRTDDAGDNWTQILAGNFQEIEFHPTDLSIIYAIKQIDNRTEFYKSTDSGASFSIKIDGWPGVSSSTTSNNFNAIKFDGNVANYISTTNLALGEGSFEEFTIEMLVKSTGWTGDPALLSNKNWSNGNNKGFILSANSNGAWKFNIGDG
ncbi:MAG: WD40/YVTN/BNR-like repeat-containing protein, partial [Chitinophagales bacterium]